MGLRARLRRLEDRAPVASPVEPTRGQDDALETYFAALAGEEVEEVYDPELEAYLEELDEQFARQREGE